MLWLKKEHLIYRYDIANNVDTSYIVQMLQIYLRKIKPGYIPVVFFTTDLSKVVDLVLFDRRVRRFLNIALDLYIWKTIRLAH